MLGRLYMQKITKHSFQQLAVVIESLLGCVKFGVNAKLVKNEGEDGVCVGTTPSNG